MKKIQSLLDLRLLREKAIVPDSEIHIKIALSTCSIASGARDTMKYISEELGKRNLKATISHTGCLVYCYAEPTVELKLPGKAAIVFGFVNAKKADEIIEHYIRNGELVDGIIPMNYQSIEEHQQ